MALNLGQSMWNSADKYLPSTTPPFAESSESTCTMLQNIKSLNEHICNYFSVPDPIDIIRKRQFNLLANLPAWTQLASLTSFSPPGLATLDALVDSTNTTKLIRQDTSAYSPKY
jgi:hypothetical protein